MGADYEESCFGVKKFQEPTGRDRYLSRDEARRFLHALNGCPNAPVASGLRLLLFTGLQAREVFELRWEDVDFEMQTVRLRKTKTGQTRRVYLSRLAWMEIQRMHEVRTGDDTFVLPGQRPGTPVMQPHRCFRRILDAAHITDFRIHDLRHTFASYMVQSGATLFEVQKALGHTTSATTQRYSHFEDAALRRRAEAVAVQLLP